MDIRRLRFFTGVAEAGSLSAAAEQMGISQPSLSRQIGLLEEELGVKLFKRQWRGVSLTLEGEKLHLRIKEPLKEISRALWEARSGSGRIKAKIVICVPPSIADLLIVALTRSFAALAPDVTVRIVEGSGGIIEALIKRKELDMFLAYGPRDTWEQLEWWHLMQDVVQEHGLVEEEMVLVGSAATSLSPHKKISVEELSALPLVFPSKPYLPVIFRKLIQEMTEYFNMNLDNIRESDSAQQTKEIITSGAAYSIMPISFILKEFDSGIMKYAPIASDLAKREVILISRKNCPFPQAQTEVIKILKNEVSNLVLRGGWQARLLF